MNIKQYGLGRLGLWLTLLAIACVSWRVQAEPIPGSDADDTQPFTGFADILPPSPPSMKPALPLF